MAYPEGTPVQEQVLQDLVETLEAIGGTDWRLTGGFPGGVHRTKGEDVFACSAFPALLISPPSVTEDQSVYGMTQCTMNLTLRGALRDSSTGQQEELSWLASDVKRAVTEDPTRGGAALDTEVIGVEVLATDESMPVVAVDVSVRIRYRHLREDPNTPI